MISKIRHVGPHFLSFETSRVCTTSIPHTFSSIGRKMHGNAVFTGLAFSPNCRLKSWEQAKQTRTPACAFCASSPSSSVFSVFLTTRHASCWSEHFLSFRDYPITFSTGFCRKRDKNWLIFWSQWSEKTPRENPVILESKIRQKVDEKIVSFFGNLYLTSEQNLLFILQKSKMSSVEILKNPS